MQSNGVGGWLLHIFYFEERLRDESLCTFLVILYIRYIYSVCIRAASKREGILKASNGTSSSKDLLHFLYEIEQTEELSNPVSNLYSSSLLSSSLSIKLHTFHPGCTPDPETCSIPAFLSSSNCISNL